MDEIKKLVDTVRKKHKGKKSADTVWAICGRERQGKSMLGLHILQQYQPDAKIGQISMTLRDFIKSIYNAKEGDGLVMDEAGDGLFSRDWNKEENKDINKLFFVIGAKKFLTVLIMPDFFSLDIGFRQRRIKGLFYVWKTGRVKFYDEYAIKNILFHKRFHKRIKFIGDWFPDYKGSLLEDYKKLKMNKIDQSISEMYRKYCVKKEETLSINQFSKMYNIGYAGIEKVSTSNNIKIPYNPSGTKGLIDKNTHDKLLEGLKILNKRKMGAGTT
jgi:hypothetical protein